MDNINKLNQIDLSKLSDLSKDDLDRLKIDIINSCDLLSIPSVLLPEVFYDNYFFISYSHKDYRSVYTDIINLQNNGVNTWYDRGIPGGKNWKDIANKYMSPINCVGVIFYISENALLSDAVIDEIEYALKLNKPVICINLPFENDYLYNGQSTLGQIYSTKGMLEILKELNLVDEKKVDIIKALLNEEKIFLPFDMHVTTRAEKINANIKEIPALRYEIDQFGELNINGVNDTNALRITKDDFPSGASNVYISSCAFANMIYLESVDFSNFFYIQDIGPFAFSSCRMLKTIINQDAITSLDNGVFANCTSLESLRLFNLRLLENSVFTNCINLKSIYLGDECYYIGERCFSNCESLEDIRLPYDLETISSFAFYKCKSLKHIDLPDSINEIQSGAFAESGLEEVILPIRLTIIESQLFEGCETLNNIILPTKLEDIGDYAFDGCTSLKHIDLPSSIKSIGEGVFSGCVNLIEIKIPEKVEFISDSLFFDCSNLQKVELPSSIKQIDSRAFKNCRSLKSITLPDSVSIISDNAFSGCTSLKQINIPSKVDTISEGMFYSCSSLKEITLSKNIKYIQNHAFRDSGLERLIYEGTKEEFDRITLGKKCFLTNQKLTIICTDSEINL